MLERGQPIVEPLDLVVGTATAARLPRTTATLLDVTAQALELPLHDLELAPLILDEAAELAVLADEIRTRGAAGCQQREDESRPLRPRLHWPRITEWARRFRAQHDSFSSRQSGSSSP